MTSHVPDLQLTELLADCQQQLHDFRAKRLEGDSTSCTEIVRRAVNGDRNALGVLLNDVSRPFIKNMVQHRLPDKLDDIVQDVYLRIMRRFQDTKKPLDFSTFSAYRQYVQVTARHVVVDALREEQFQGSDITFDDAVRRRNVERHSCRNSSHTRIVLREVFQTILGQLTDPIEREVFERRIGLQESPDEITEWLKKEDPDITKHDVYTHLRNAKRRLRENPYVQSLRADLY